MLNRLYLGLSVVLCLFVAGLVAVVFFGRGNPLGTVAAILAEGPAKDVASQFLDDLSKAKVDQAYEKTTKAYQSHLKAEEFRALVRSHPGLHSAKLTDMQTRDLTNDQATFKASLDGPNGTLDVIVEASIKEGNGWKVNRFTVCQREKLLAPGSTAAAPIR
jgi:hypothetical protein